MNKLYFYFQTRKEQTMFEMIQNPELLDKIFSYLRDPASVKAVSLVSR